LLLKLIQLSPGADRFNPKPILFFFIQSSLSLQVMQVYSHYSFGISFFNSSALSAIAFFFRSSEVA
jgi:hypothetical protein